MNLTFKPGHFFSLNKTMSEAEGQNKNIYHSYKAKTSSRMIEKHNARVNTKIGYTQLLIARHIKIKC